MLNRITLKHALLGVCVVSMCLGACSNSEDASAYIRERAAEAEKDNAVAAAAVISVETALESDKDLACADVLPVEELTELLEEKEQVTLSDTTAKNPDSTSTCSIRRGGKPLDTKTQERLAEKTGRLGVMGGDEICNMTLYCSVPADVDGLKQRCEAEKSLGNHTLGVYACVKVTQKGEHDGYSYKFIDEDTKCMVLMRGGPSVIEEPVVQACSRAAMKLLTPAVLETAFTQGG